MPQSISPKKKEDDGYSTADIESDEDEPASQLNTEANSEQEPAPEPSSDAAESTESYPVYQDDDGYVTSGMSSIGDYDSIRESDILHERPREAMGGMKFLSSPGDSFLDGVMFPSDKNDKSGSVAQSASDSLVDGVMFPSDTNDELEGVTTADSNADGVMFPSEVKVSADLSLAEETKENTHFSENESSEPKKKPGVSWAVEIKTGSPIAERFRLLCGDIPGDLKPWRRTHDTLHRSYNSDESGNAHTLFYSHALRRFDQDFDLTEDTRDEFYIDLFFRYRYWNRRRDTLEPSSLFEAWNQFIDQFNSSEMVNKLEKALKSFTKSDINGKAAAIHRLCNRLRLPCAGSIYCKLCPPDAIKMTKDEVQQVDVESELGKCLIELKQLRLKILSKQPESAESADEEYERTPPLREPDQHPPPPPVRPTPVRKPRARHPPALPFLSEILSHANEICDVARESTPASGLSTSQSGPSTSQSGSSASRDPVALRCLADSSLPFLSCPIPSRDGIYTKFRGGPATADMNRVLNDFLYEMNQRYLRAEQERHERFMRAERELEERYLRAEREREERYLRAEREREERTTRMMPELLKNYDDSLKRKRSPSPSPPSPPSKK